jgi:hypothetical protein
VVIEKSVNEAEKEPLARLARALDTSDDDLRATLTALGLVDPERARFMKDAQRLRQRASAQTPHASAVERALALGVLWALHGGQCSTYIQVAR